jgi:hypothetical protein
MDNSAAVNGGWTIRKVSKSRQWYGQAAQATGDTRRWSMGGGAAAQRRLLDGEEKWVDVVEDETEDEEPSEPFSLSVRCAAPLFIKGERSGSFYSFAVTLRYACTWCVLLSCFRLEESRGAF